MTDQMVMGVVQWIGLILGLGGLAFAIWQISKTRTAAEAAASAAQDAVRSVFSRELMLELQNAAGNIESARHHISARKYDAAAIFLELGHSDLLQVHELLSTDLKEKRAVFKVMVRLGRLRTDIERDEVGQSVEQTAVARGLEAREISNDLKACVARQRYRYDDKERA
jgi:hypothetical protein